MHAALIVFILTMMGCARGAASQHYPAPNQDANLEPAPFPAAFDPDRMTKYQFTLPPRIEAAQVSGLDVELAVVETDAKEGYFIIVSALPDEKHPDQKVRLGTESV